MFCAPLDQVELKRYAKTRARCRRYRAAIVAPVAIAALVRPSLSAAVPVLGFVAGIKAGSSSEAALSRRWRRTATDSRLTSGSGRQPDQAF